MIKTPPSSISSTGMKNDTLALLCNEICAEYKELFFWLIRSTIQKYHKKVPPRGNAIIKLVDQFLDFYNMCFDSTDGEVRKVIVEDSQELISATLRLSVRSVTRSLHVMNEQKLITLVRGRISITEENAKKMEDLFLKSL